MPTPSLDHIEKTFADGYRKEIDQEENVWRSLPFFAATLALQIAALAGVEDRLPPLDGPGRWWVLVPLSTAGGSTFLALVGMAAAIYPVRFAYLSPEPDLLDYVRELDEAERANPPPKADAQDGAAGAARDDAATALKTELAKQYAAATHRNRRINQRRALFRSVSGLFTLLSVLSILVVVTVAMRHHISGHAAVGAAAPGEAGDATAKRDSPGPAPAAPAAVRDGAGPSPAVRGGAPADARSDEGVVQQPGAPGAPGGDRGR
jgi:hypothetical protein